MSGGQVLQAEYQQINNMSLSSGYYTHIIFIFWILIGRTDAEAEAPKFWSPDVGNWLIRKDLDAGKDWRQEKKGMTEDEIFGWHHQLDGHEFEWAPGVGDGQGGLAFCSPQGHKESDTTERLNWTESVVIKTFSSVFVLTAFFKA